MSLANNGIAIVNLLAGADNFMTFDTTIVETIIPVLNFSCTTNATDAIRGIRVALLVAPSTHDASDMTRLFTDSIGPPWMWFAGDELRTNAIGKLNLSLAFSSAGAIRAKSKRRFRENESTLFLVIDNQTESGDTILFLSGFCRTLIHIP